MRIGIILVVLVLGLIIFKNEIIKTVVARRIRAETGMDVKIGTFDVGLLSPTVTIKNFKLYNTAEFGGSVLLDIPEFHMEYDRNALSLHKLHLILLRFNLAELHQVKNPGGQLNVTSLMGKMQTRVAKPDNGKIGGTKYEFEGIDTLELTLGRFKTTDLGNPGKNEVREIGWTNQVVSNVKSIGDLYGGLFLIMLKQGRLDFPRHPSELTNGIANPLTETFPPPKTNEAAPR
jgi:hypothetical protein